MAAPPSRPALRAKYDRKQQEVVAAAARIFARRGFHATSIEDLVEATGLTAGGLYHYIGSKDALLVRICDHLMEPLLAEVREIVASGGPAGDQLQAVMHAWMARVERNRDHMLVFQQERHVLENGPQWKQVRRQRKAFEELLGDVLARGEREGAFAFPDRALAQRALLGMVNHTATWFRPRGRLTGREIADGYLALLLGETEVPVT